MSERVRGSTHSFGAASCIGFEARAPMDWGDRLFISEQRALGRSYFAIANMMRRCETDVRRLHEWSETIGARPAAPSLVDAQNAEPASTACTLQERVLERLGVSTWTREALAHVLERDNGSIGRELGRLARLGLAGRTDAGWALTARGTELARRAA